MASTILTTQETLIHSTKNQSKKQTQLTSATIGTAPQYKNPPSDEPPLCIAICMALQ